MEELVKLLSFASKNNTIDVAKKLFSRFNGLKEILSADIYELEELTESSKVAMLIKLCAELWSRSITDGFSFGAKHSLEEIQEYFKGLFFGFSDERVYMMSIDVSDKVTGCDLVGEGTVNAAGVIPRQILEVALRNKARKVILAHNHPNGDVSASDDDLNMTHMLYKLLSVSGIELIEHYVVSLDKCRGIITKGKECFV